ncbi:MAG: hypothetical protein V4629_03035 [Pseudomonadota bacterium]
MAITPSTATITLSLGGDGFARTYDPLGSYFNGISLKATQAPVITLVSAEDPLVAVGAAFSVVFQVQAAGVGYAFKSAGPDDAVLTVSESGETLTLSWTSPVGMAADSIYFGVGVMNEFSDVPIYKYNRVHVGKTQVLKAGVGFQYAHFRAANQVLVSGGTVVMKDGTYSTDDWRIGPNGSGAGNRLPAKGVYTEDNTGIGGGKKYYCSKRTTIMAETPFGIVYRHDLNTAGEDRTNVAACEIYGDENFDAEETFYNDTETGGAAFFTPFQFAPWGNQNFIAVKGLLIVSNSSAAIFQIRRSVGTYFQYCGAIGLGGQFGFYNHSLARQCLIENCLYSGGARSVASSYKGPKEITHRRFLFTKQQVPSGWPNGGLNCYGARRWTAQNCIEIGSKGSGDYWTHGGDDTASFAMPDTNVNGFGPTAKTWQTDVTFSNCMAVGTDESMFRNDSFEFRQRYRPYDGIKVDGLVGWDTQTCGTSYPMISGPGYLSRIASNKVRTLLNAASFSQNAKTAFIGTLRGTLDISKLILSNISLSPTTGELKSAADSGGLFFVNFPVNEPINVTDGLVWNFNGTKTYLINDRQPVETNVKYPATSYDPLTNGWTYPHKIDAGSRLDLDGLSFGNVMHSVGKQGTFFGDTGFTEVIASESWAETIDYEPFRQQLVGRTYTGPKKSGGTGTLNWERNHAVPGEHWFEWIIKQSGKTIYPWAFSVHTFSNRIYLRVRRYAENNMTNLVKFKVYINDAHADDIYPNEHGLLLNKLPAGTHKIQLSADDSVTGESGLSVAKTVVI